MAIKPIPLKMRSFRLFVVLFILFGSKLIVAQDALLWRISGNGLSKPSYLFGTIHLHCQPYEVVKTVLTNAIDSSNVVALELNFFDYDTRVAMLKSEMAKSDKTISSQLNQKQIKLVDSVCQALLGQPLTDFDNRSPMMLMSRLYSTKSIVSCSEPVPIDILIAGICTKTGKEIFGLESFAFQDSLIKSFPDSLQIAWLLDFCQNTDSAKSEFNSMTTLYNQQKALALYGLLVKNSPEMIFFKEQLLDDRNYRWLEFLKDNMKEVSIFMAVGAAHLGGETGLIAALRAAGYTVTPIIIK